MIDHTWCTQLMRCAEGLYILEEDTKKIVWANSFFQKKFAQDIVGMHCWQVFLTRESPCPFCPILKVDGDVYVWDHYDPQGKRWMKIKHVLFEKDGIRYRAGNVNMLDDVMRLNYETVQEIISLHSILGKKQQEIIGLTREALSDTLTGLLNRNCFQLDLERRFATVPGLTVLYFDLNNLKEVNDLYRHANGDILLRRMASTLRRTADHFMNARCYRIGGDEFVLLFSHGTPADLDRCEALFQSYLHDYNSNEPIPCHVAVGRAFSAQPCDPERLVSHADHDMYRCKQKMKGQNALPILTTKETPDGSE